MKCEQINTTINEIWLKTQSHVHWDNVWCLESQIQKLNLILVIIISITQTHPKLDGHQQTSRSSTPLMMAAMYFLSLSSVVFNISKWEGTLMMNMSPFSHVTLTINLVYHQRAYDSYAYQSWLMYGLWAELGGMVPGVGVLVVDIEFRVTGGSGFCIVGALR